ncbi:MAG TPA: aminoglycoside phosphotransferase family protein [Longimicrobiaceae bacterium]
MNEPTVPAIAPAAERMRERVRAWGVSVDATLETESSLVAFGTRGGEAVALKIVRRPGDEWRCGEVLAAFGGRGMVRALDHVPGAVLMERLAPATPLVEMALAGRDDEATAVLAEVMLRMSDPPAAPPPDTPTVERWGRALDWYLTTGDAQIPRDLVEQARETYAALCASQGEARLLHGDLQHYNVLLDARRGWTAIDPKGVAGEAEYEIGAALRNPGERPDLFASPAIVERRLRQYEAALGVDAGRALAWGFAQAVLSAVWYVEDGFPVGARNPSLLLADAIRPMLR